ncbi:hypothetical protein HB665_15350 [Bacillus paranthracis]|uniref:hypothetical protein n=1 Tax=Bacillus cereus group TaxID=86661 RepID=UPI0014447D48|nr:hypothetical protein [Bacillus paranthracis]NKX25542.1 hypothetical protein [Bacillus paranthracis]
MSMNTTFKTWKEMLESIAKFENPICLSINYDPDKDEYKLWAGNQPYYFYDEEIEKLENAILDLRNEKNDTQLFLEETIEKLESELKRLRSSKDIKKKPLYLEHMLISSPMEAYATFYLPTLGDIEICVYDHRKYEGAYLIVIPYLKWSSYVKDFYNFSTTNKLGSNVAKTIGDIKINTPEVELYMPELRLIFSLTISLLYKEFQNENGEKDNSGVLGLNIEEHINLCKIELDGCGVDLTGTTFE